ncbi:alanine--tRNA ligase, mitochondrial isoform X2 [Rhineura floridana]|uniref:alanine--tRNA ligase, mitochondrial isoform X2 n=1 Tax=Rhineura floridana TaxID=261503 RepID=UPI002AC8295A|nr:alanine--tRNA ligase, mitochondrial isoform X2 [Rhineura floridana]
MAAAGKGSVKHLLRVSPGWFCTSRRPRCTASLSSGRARQAFLQFFKERYGHQVVPSAPVRPLGDPGLLFVNAGMNQEEACNMAWELLTQVYEIPKDRLYVTYFGGDASHSLCADEESREIWLTLGVLPSHVLPFQLKENFWEMGDTGPCGPCTEIHYDHVGGGRNAAALVNQGSPDVVEIWNLVFMQYSRETDGSLHQLPQHHVDTGMGLERLMTVLQNKRSNYDTDLFTPILDAIHKGCGGPSYQGLVGEADPGGVNMAYRVVADHVRTLSVCIADGVYPGMSGAELVLRHILRRAVRFCSEVLRAVPGFLASLVPVVVEILGDAYPELRKDTDTVMNIINENEDAFLSSLLRGRHIINRTLQHMDNSKVFPVEVAWSLYSNLGFPLDLIGLMLEEKGVQLDTAALDHLAQEDAKRKAQSQQEERAGMQLNVHSLAKLRQDGVPATDDSLKFAYVLGQDGRYVFRPCQATVLMLYKDGSLQKEVAGGQHCGVLLDRTCFYAEQGGQAPDQGYMVCAAQQDVLFPVVSVHASGGYVVHEVIVSETLKAGDQVHLFVDEAQRLACMTNHTATHLLNFALRQVLGDSTKQRGSHVTAEHLRFDVSTKAPIRTQQLQDIESVIQEVIKRNEVVYTVEVPIKMTNDVQGLRKLDEVYPDLVRVVSVGVPVENALAQESLDSLHASVELCCGTHLLQTGAVQDFTIISERQLVKGISHIVAVTGDRAKQARELGQSLAKEVDSLTVRVKLGGALIDEAQRLSKEVGHLTITVDSATMPLWQKRELQAMLKTLQRTANTAIRKLETKLAAEKADDLLTKYSTQPVIIDTIPVESPSVLMKVVNQLCDRIPGSSVMLLSPQASGQVFCACQVSKSSLPMFSAADWALAVCTQMGGKAGGSRVVAKGMGRTNDLQMVLTAALEYAKNKL